MSSISSMNDIQDLFKKTIAEFLEGGLDAELEDELGCRRCDYKNKDTDNSVMGTEERSFAQDSAMWRCSCPVTAKASLSRRC